MSPFDEPKDDGPAEAGESRRRAANQPKPICLALQGGGAHGAFTWGVIDKILEDGSLSIEAVSGTSAGAMNAAVLADGFARGGAEMARTRLREFWQSISEHGWFHSLMRTPPSHLRGDWSLDDSPGYIAFDLLSRMLSPYDLNPLNVNPLLSLIEETIDFEMVRQCTAFRLFISATNVETGRVRVFEKEELTAQMVMASACLPHLFQAVEIDGVPYWDGGYMGNPALWPFFDTCYTNDIVIVQINPLVRQGAPKTAQEIMNRLNEITFNASLQRELRAIDFVSRLIEDGRLDSERYRHVLVHRIHSDEMCHLTASSKLNAEWAFIEHLFDLGRRSAEGWLDRHCDQIGHESTVDIRALFD